MWQRLELPDLGGPIRGFTFPHRDVLFVQVPDGLVRVSLDPVEVRQEGGSEAAVIDGWVVWDGGRHLIHDANGGDITLGNHPSGDRIVSDVDGTLLITDPDEQEVRQRIVGVRIPADRSWMYAGFSSDGRWLVAGEPAGVQAFRRAPDAAPGHAADPAS
jgi:hypothetical protein